MHLHARYTGANLLIQAAAVPPFGPGFTAAQVAQVDTLEVWVTSIQDVADTTIWRLMRNGSVIVLHEVGGF